MNPLTLVKRIKEINEREATLGISDEASWHVKYKDSAYVFVGGIPFDLTEGDLLAVFAQYGEIVDVNLVRDKGTGKSKGFAFVAYEDQRSTNLAVDNLNGAQVLGRTIRVDHCSKYKKMEEEDEETVRQKREARGVCRAFQKGECTRGDSCKFSHDAQRAANTGWGEKEDRHTRRGNEEEGFQRNGRKPNQFNRFPESSNREGHRTHDRERDERNRMKESDRDSDRSNSRRRDNDEQMTRDDRNLSHREDRKRSDYDEDIDKRGEKRGRGGYREERESRGSNGYDRKYSPSRRRNDEDREHRSSSHR